MPEIPKAYEPQAVEEKWYQFWTDQQCFVADPHSSRPAYSIVIPPPNVTGVLTLGHVLNNTIQDILARRARMLGKEVLWLPGTDHAGIATQTVVERTLKKQGLIRHRNDLGRDKFLEKVWEWKEKHGGIIIQQLKRLGASCDWSRERFTMDPDYSRCVQRVFVDLYQKGLIYRGKRMVNWCPVSLTALSDEEVIMKPQNGVLYYFKVEVVELPGTWLTIATTRPETIPGDTAIAVNPRDERYAHLIGKHVRRPLPIQVSEEEKRIPIVGDEHVDYTFGTGVLKVTPAHDTADFEIGRRHRLPAIDIMNPDGTMNALAGESLVGLDRFEARNVAVDHLHQLGVLVKEEPYQNNVGYSERADVPIEPRLSEQWFLKYPCVERARACVTPPDAAPGPPALRFHPDRWAKVYDHWLEGIQDWCISRQLWWGHRIPVWYRDLPQAVLEKKTAVIDLPAGGDGNAPASDAMQAALATARSSGILGATFRNGDTGWSIRVRTTSFDHLPAAGVAEVALRLVHVLPALLETALLIPPAPQQDQPGGHRLAAALRFGGCLYRVTLVVRDGAAGEKLLAHWSTVPLHGPGPGAEHLSAAGDTVSRATAGGEGGGPGPGISFRELCFGPNPDEELQRCQIEPPGPGYVQDPDVLDTWFSSWLWPFATMGWTGDRDADARNATLAKFYPTTDLVTGPDIIFFWVARMIMAGLEFMGEVPFRNVYFTGIIRDKQGRKMSKSLGNSPDPLDLIAKYGADALRFGIMRSAPQGQDLLYDEKHVELGRNFCNKLWNACRFRQMHGRSGVHTIQPALLTSDDRWILRRLDRAIREINQAFADYRFSEVTAVLYRFFWSEYCDWYVEASKAVLKERAGVTPSGTGSVEPQAAEPCRTAAALYANKLAVIDFVLSHALRLLHPFLPFITEELWHDMGFHEALPADKGGTTIQRAAWPAPLDAAFKACCGLDDAAEERAAANYQTVELGRNLRGEFRLASNRGVRFVLKPARDLAPEDVEVLRLLLNADPLEVRPEFTAPKGTPTVLTPLGELSMPLEGLIDVEAERARLRKEIGKAEAELAKVRVRLHDPVFTAKVPPQVLEEHQQRETHWAGKLEQLKKMLDALG